MPLDPRIIQTLRDAIDGYRAAEKALSEAEAALRLQRAAVRGNTEAAERAERELVAYVLLDQLPERLRPVEPPVEPEPEPEVDPVAPTEPAPAEEPEVAVRARLEPEG